MSAEGVKSIIGQMISEPGFKKEFHRDPTRTIAKSGYAVNQDEAVALSFINENDLQVLSQIRKFGSTAVCSVDVRAAAR